MPLLASAPGCVICLISVSPKALRRVHQPAAHRHADQARDRQRPAQLLRKSELVCFSAASARCDAASACTAASLSGAEKRTIGPSR